MQVLLKNALLGFNDIFDAKLIGDSTVKKFSATGICDEDTTIQYTNGKGEKVEVPYEKMQQVCDHALKQLFGKIPVKHKNWCFNKADGSTTRDRYTDKDGEFWAGVGEDTWYISATKAQNQCKTAPKAVTGPNGEQTVEEVGYLPIFDQYRKPLNGADKLFSGCRVNLLLDVYAFKAKKNSPDGVTASLEGVQLKEVGEPLGFSRIDAENEFEAEEFEEGEIDFGAEPTDEMM